MIVTDGGITAGSNSAATGGGCDGRSDFEKISNGERGDAESGRESPASLRASREKLASDETDLRATSGCATAVADYRAFEGGVRRWIRGSSELCRARVAYLLGGRTTAIEATRLRARVCECADKFVLDPHGVTDADTAAVAAHLPPAAMVALIEALALSTGSPLSPDPSGCGLSGRRGPPPSGPAQRRSALRGPLGHQPALWQAFQRLYGTLWSRGVLDHAIAKSRVPAHHASLAADSAATGASEAPGAKA
jgi:hypothetical protein